MNDTDPTWPQLPTICDYLLAHAKSQPATLAISDQHQTLTYSELSVLVRQISISLISLGVTAGDRIAVVVPKRIESVAVVLAAMQINAIAVPINPLLKNLQISHIVNDCGAKVLFMTSQTLLDRKCVCNLTTTIIYPDSRNLVETQEYSAGPTSKICTTDTYLQWSSFLITNAPIDHHFPLVKPETYAAVLYTSGSTGPAKGVTLTHKNLSYGAVSVTEYLNNSKSDRILAIMPLSFDYGLSQLTTSLVVGAYVHLADYFVPKSVIEMVVKHRISGLAAVPHLWNKLASLDWSVVNSLRYITNTGGHLPEQTINKLTACLPSTDLYLMYGFTESFRSTWLNPNQLHKKTGSIGKAIPYSTLRVVDSQGNIVPPGESGELIHASPMVAAGYWNNPQATQLKFRKRTIDQEIDRRTYAWSGDLVKTDSEGYFYYLSRMDDQMKLHGYRVNSGEIECVIMSCDYVADTCVITAQHPSLGECAIAIVASTEFIDTTSLRIHCQRVLPSYMVPTEFILVKTLPINVNNKVDRRLLSEQYRNHFIESE